MKSITKLMKAAREAQPDLWERTDAIARIIDPAAFIDGWTIHPSDSATVLKSRLKYKQSVALCKAQEVLKYLGVNVDADWYEILKRLAEDES